MSLRNKLSVQHSADSGQEKSAHSIQRPADKKHNLKAERFSLNAKRSTLSSGFTLIEVLIAIVILATGIVLVIEAMGRTQQALRISENLVTSTQIAEEKFAESELEVRQLHKLRFASHQGQEKKIDRTFDWEKNVKGYRDAVLEKDGLLNQVSTRVRWREGIRDNSLNFSSLLLNREKENKRNE